MVVKTKGELGIPCLRALCLARILASLMASANPLSLLSAALRHLHDAKQLAAGCVCPEDGLADAQPPAIQHQSLDQAEHLIGFAPECARKACLSARWLDQSLGHDLSTAANDLLDLALSLDAYAARYPIRDWPTRFPELARWTPNVRYKPTTRDPQKVTLLTNRVDALLREAAIAVNEVLISLYVDGRLDPMGEL